MRVLIVINFEFELLRCVAGRSLNSSRRIGTAIPGTPVINTKKERLFVTLLKKSVLTKL
jgi:hypothetical protein